MAIAVIVLNGGSSSGKSGIARCLQAVLPDLWLTLGTDTLIEAMPGSAQLPPQVIQFPADGSVVIGPEFRAAESAWIAYDLEVDTTRTEALDCARMIAARLR